MKCTALIFSGRKNPEWEVTAEDKKQQITTLLKAAKATKGTLNNSILGYAGFRVAGEDFTFEIFNGLIEVASANEKTFLLDADRTIEKILLETVPKKFSGIINSAITTSF